jgi:hypothetical protein
MFPSAGAVGALDGTHVELLVPAENAMAFRNRKEFTSTNVLACVNFDGRFVFAVAGMEGTFLSKPASFSYLLFAVKNDE